jgi:signal transduction histidine kinase
MLLTSAAHRHITALLRAVEPQAGRLERAFRVQLRRQGHSRAAVEALCAVSPAAAARLGSAARFLKQVEREGRRLAKLNLSLHEVFQSLSAFDLLLAPVLGGRFAPAREQLQLAAALALHEAFYHVRESEVQAFFGLYRAEIEAQDFSDLLRRFAAVLGRAFRARAVHVAILEESMDPRLRSPLHIARSAPEERLILDCTMRSRYAAWWSFPLSESAVVQFGLDDDASWLPRDWALVRAAASRCREAAERLQLAEQVRRLEAEAWRAEENERRRIGRELHDETGQSLLLLRLELEMMEREAPEPLRQRLASARAIAERTVVELRRIVAALSPAVLERLGLKAALRQLGARFRKMCPARLRMRLAVSDAQIAPEAQQVIYRIAQEALHNIARHSQATFVNLSLDTADMAIRLCVSDNGTGFETQEADLKSMSFGLAGMRERATLLGGSLSINSAPGKGVRIRLLLPSSTKVASYGKDSRANNG